MPHRRPRYRNDYRRYHRTGRNDSRHTFSSRAEVSPVFSWLITLVVAGLVFGGFLSLFESKIQPVIIAVASAGAQNTALSMLDRALTQEIESSDVKYEQLVSIQRDERGQITALTSNVKDMNLLRSRLTAAVIDSLEHIETNDLDIPLGSLLHSGLLWGYGPSIQVRALSIGTLSSNFQSQFTSAGFNQTLHRICLEVDVPITVLLPGKSISVPVHSTVCVAETVIVGRVPDTYLYRQSAI